MLSTFVLVHKDKVISPELVTVREYGRWFKTIFDDYTTQQELWKPAKTDSTISSVDWHPGSKIGKWFDKNCPESETLKSWYITQDSDVMKSLVKYHLAEYSDVCNNRKLNSQVLQDTSGMLRVYTVEQIQFYLQSTIDKKFDISSYINASKQIKVKDTDLDKLIIPKALTGRKKLF